MHEVFYFALSSWVAGNTIFAGSTIVAWFANWTNWTDWAGSTWITVLAWSTWITILAWFTGCTSIAGHSSLTFRSRAAFYRIRIEVSITVNSI